MNISSEHKSLVSRLTNDSPRAASHHNLATHQQINVEENHDVPTERLSPRTRNTERGVQHQPHCLLKASGTLRRSCQLQRSVGFGANTSDAPDVIVEVIRHHSTLDHRRRFPNVGRKAQRINKDASSKDRSKKTRARTRRKGGSMRA